MHCTHLFQDSFSRSFHALVIALNFFNTQQAGKIHQQILKCIMGDSVAITVEPLKMAPFEMEAIHSSVAEQGEFRLETSAQQL